MEVFPHGANSPPALDRAAAEHRSEFDSATTPNPSSEANPATDPCSRQSLAESPPVPSTVGTPAGAALDHAANHVEVDPRSEQGHAPTPLQPSTAPHAPDQHPNRNPATARTAQSTEDGPGTEATVRAAKSADPEPRPGAAPATTLLHNSEEQAALDLPPAPPRATPTVALQSPMSRLMSNPC